MAKFRFKKRAGRYNQSTGAYSKTKREGFCCSFEGFVFNEVPQNVQNSSGKLKINDLIYKFYKCDTIAQLIHPRYKRGRLSLEVA